jgi:hypothetical protein
VGRISVHAQEKRDVVGTAEEGPPLFPRDPFEWEEGDRRKDLYGLGEPLLALESPPLSARRKDPVRLGIQCFDITIRQRFLRLKEIDPDAGRTGSRTQNVVHIGRVSYEKEEVWLLCFL